MAKHEKPNQAAVQLWHQLLNEGSIRTGTTLDDATQSYLVCALMRHLGDPHLMSRVYCVDWIEAQAQEAEERVDSLRDIGDRCLIIAGMYPNFAASRNVPNSYFAQTGKAAYAEIARCGTHADSPLFEKLSDIFPVITLVLESLQAQTPSGRTSYSAEEFANFYDEELDYADELDAVEYPEFVRSHTLH